MNKTRNIIGWIMGGLITALFLFSASQKLMGGEAKMRNIIVAQSKKGEIIKIDKNT